MVSDKTIHKPFGIHKTLYRQLPLERVFLYFHILPKLYFGFNKLHKYYSTPCTMWGSNNQTIFELSFPWPSFLAAKGGWDLSQESRRGKKKKEERAWSRNYHWDAYRPYALTSSCRHVGGQSHCFVRAFNMRCLRPCAPGTFLTTAFTRNPLVLTPNARGRPDIMTSYA